MVIAPIRAGREDDLRALLATMTNRPGMADPDNALLPFGRFEELHFARFVILRDDTLGDLAAYGLSFPDAPVALAFLADCDGDGGAFMAALVARAGEGLRRIFAHCEGVDAHTDLLAWMRAHAARPAAQYVNWVGRTARRVREDAALHRALANALRDAQRMPDATPRTLLAALRAHVARERDAGRLTLTPEAPTPPAWQAARWRNLLGVPLLLLAVSPLLLLYLPLFLILLRRHERADPEIAPRPTDAHVAALSSIEDADPTNQFSAFGSTKPGWFRFTTLRFVFFVLEYSTRHVYTRGRLSRVSTIHFARWVFVDSGRRLLFCSNYDGSLDSYMDDFINKVAWGLNLVFSNGIGYPRTAFLIAGGAQREQQFKAYLRRHQIPTQVWYKAYPGLTTGDLQRNAALRAALDTPLDDAALRQFLAMI